MGFTTSNLSLYHTFSKTPVDSNTSSAAAQLGNAINKSGHTVQSNEIWTESIPFYGLAATTTAIHTKFSATAKVNDLVKDSDGKIWQRNSTAYTEGATFANLWSEKTKSITSFTKGTDGKYTFTETDGALVDGSYLLNSEGVPTVKYYEKRLLTRLTADNNANTNSDNKASRLQIDGKWIDQFIGVTDIYLNGSAAVSYAPVLRKTASSSPMQSGPGKAYMDYCATGLILWESSAAGTEVIDCFEYVGTKLDATVAKLSAAVFGSNNGGSDQPTDLVTQVNLNTAAIATLNGDADETGSVANQIASATSTLASKSEITINDIKVKVGSGTATSLVPDNKSVTIEIPDAPEADVTTEGVVTTDGFTKTAAVTSLAKAAIKAALADTAEGSLGDKIGDVESIASQAKTTADSAVQSVTRATGSSELITVTDGTNATISLSTEVATKTDAANAASTAITTSLAGTTEGTIGKAISDVQSTADSAIKSVSGPTSGLVTVNTDSGTKAVTIAVSDKLASTDDITLTGIKLNNVAVTATNKVANITAIEGVTTTAVNGVALAKDGNNVKVTVTPAIYTSSNRSWDSDTYLTKASDVKVAIADAVADAVDTIIIPEVELGMTAMNAGFSSSENVTPGKHYIDLATATYTPASDDTAASWTNKSYLVTGATVEAFVGAETTKTLEAAKAYSDSLHTTSVTYHVADTLPTVPSGEEEDYKGRIYLVLTGLDNKVAADGARLEYMYVNKGTESAPQWGWEQIGTTTADLSGYAKSVKINSQTYTANAANAGALDLGTVVNKVMIGGGSVPHGGSGANVGSLMAHITDGALYLGIASATNTVMGVSKLYTGSYDVIASVTDKSNTAVSLSTVSEMYSGLNGKIDEKADADSVVTSIVNPEGDGANGLWVQKSSNSSLYYVSISSATPTQMGVSKLFTGSYYELPSSATDTAVSAYTASEMFSNINGRLTTKADANNVVNSINGTKGEITFCVHNGVSNPSQPISWEGEGEGYKTSTHANLWGTGVYTDDGPDGSIVVVDSFVGLPWAYDDYSYLQLAALPSNAVTVENNFVMDGNGKVITTIRPERMYSGFQANNANGLKSFVGDLSNLTTAKYGDNYNEKTFYGSTALESFIGDLSSLTDGYCMFNACYNLTTFISDLSNLTDGYCMFERCKLNAESLECIADTINDVHSLITSDEDIKRITIGYNCSAAAAQAAYDTITDKGWTCEMTYNA